MSLISGIFNSTAVEIGEDGFARGNKAVDASFLAELFSSFLSNGVVGEGALRSSLASEGRMSVATYPGACYIQGYFAYDKQPELITFPVSPDSRIAARVLRLDLADGSIRSFWVDCVRVAGVLVSASDGQVLPIRSDTVYDLVTCIVEIPGNATALTRDQVQDTRGDDALCGFAGLKLATK